MVAFLIMERISMKNEITEFEKVSDIARKIIIHGNNRILGDGIFEALNFSRYHKRGGRDYEEVTDFINRFDSLREKNNESISKPNKTLNWKNENFESLENRNQEDPIDLIPSMEVLSNSNNKVLQRSIKTINTSRIINNLSIYEFNIPYLRGGFTINKMISEYNVVENDTLRIPLRLSSHTYGGKELYSFIDTLNFRTQGSNRGEFVIPITKEIMKSNSEEIFLYNFLLEGFTGQQVRLRETIKLNLVKKI